MGCYFTLLIEYRALILGYLGGIMSDLFYNKTVTVFNSSPTDDVMGDETWYPTVLYNVRLLETRGRNIAKNGVDAADSATLHIRTDNLEKPYLEPKAWDALADKSKAFTLCQERDFFVVGDVSDVQIVDDFFQHMKDNYDGVYMITNTDKYELIPHLEVGGK